MRDNADDEMTVWYIDDVREFNMLSKADSPCLKYNI